MKARSVEAAELIELLDQLPDEFLVVTLHAAWFVAGPPGTYVVGLDDPDLVEDACPGRLAGRIRNVLAQHLSWIPFVHAMVVSSDEYSLAQATIVPPDMLLEVLTEGRLSLEPKTLARIREVAGRGLITRVAPPVEQPSNGARMPPCDPSRGGQAPNSASMNSANPAMASKQHRRS